MPDRDDRLPGEPEPRFSEGQEHDVESAEKERIGNFASREASSEEIGPLGEPPAHDRSVTDRGHPVAPGGSERPGSVAGDALDDEASRGDRDRPARLRGDLTAGLTDVVVGPGADETGRRGVGDDQEDRPEQERHRRFSEGQEDEGETPEKERQGDFATGQREDDDDR